MVGDSGKTSQGSMVHVELPWHFDKSK